MRRDRTRAANCHSSVRQVTQAILEALERRTLLSGSIASGQTVAGAVGQGEQVAYSFSALDGNTFDISLGDDFGSQLHPYLQVIDPNGVRVINTSSAGTDTSVDGSYTVPAGSGGTFTAIVSDQSIIQPGGAYELELAVAPAAQSADSDGDGGSISSGQTKAGSIGRPGDLDIFTFSASDGDTFDLTLGDAGFASSFHPYLQIIDPSGIRVINTSSAGTGTSVDGNYRVPAGAGGTYTVIVRDDFPTGTGAYDLEMAKAPASQAPDSDGDGGIIASGRTKAGTINRPGDLDIFTFSASAGDTFDITLGDADAISAFHPYLQIIDPSGIRVINTSSAGTGTSVDGNYRVPAGAGGIYTVIVRDDFPTGSGNYDLEMAKAPATQAPDSNGDGGTISSGQTKRGTINRPGDLDIFTFSAADGQTFDMTLGDSDSNGTFHPYLQIYDPSGTRIINTASAGTATSVDGSYRVPTGSGGTYTVIVGDDFPTGTGNYDLELAEGPAMQSPDSDGDGGPIASGQTRSGTINRPGDLDIFTFSASDGDTFDLTLGDTNSDSTFHPYLQIIDPSGIRVINTASAGTGTSVEGNYRVPTGSGGTYTVIVRDDFPTGTGAYDLEIAKAPATQLPDSDGDGGALLSGKAIPGTINRPGDLDIFTFSATAGDTFNVKLSDADSSSGFHPYLQVLDPLGTRIDNVASAGTNTSVQGNYTVPDGSGGTYTVIVQDDFPGGVGGYTVQVSGNLLQTLAHLSQDVYSIAPVGYPAQGFTPIASDSDPANLGYAAEAYEDSGQDQIVIAFRGTVPSVGEALLKDLAADTSFVTSTPSSLLISQVSDATLFIERIYEQYSDHPIILTGHSLGGALAQLEGFSSKLKTRTFNAPGSGSLYNALTPHLPGVLGTDGTNINYRLYGDQVSLAGTPIGQTVTLADPPGTTFSSLTGLGSVANLVANLETFLTLHSIDTVVSQIDANAPTKNEDSAEPNDAVPLEKAFTPQWLLFGSSPDQSIYRFLFLVDTGVQIAGALLDPGTGSDFTLAGSATSPAMSSVVLPELAGVASYNIRYKVGDTWSDYQTALPGVLYTLGQPSRTIEFQPLDAAGQNITTTESFFLDINFATTGTFDGTLTSSAAFVAPLWLSLGAGAYATLSNTQLTLSNGSATITSDLSTTNSGLAVVLDGSASIAFSSNANIGALTLNDASRASITGTKQTLAVTGLTIGPSAQMDLATNSLIVDYGQGTSPLPTIVSYLENGYDGGVWQGLGGLITSAGGPTSHTAIGYIGGNGTNGVPVGSELLTYALQGDTTLKGSVGLSDYNTLAANFNKPGSWAQGDFDYDGVVTLADYNALAANFNKSITPAAITSNVTVAKPDIQIRTNDTASPVAMAVQPPASKPAMPPVTQVTMPKPHASPWRRIARHRRAAAAAVRRLRHG